MLPALLGSLKEESLGFHEDIFRYFGPLQSSLVSWIFEDVPNALVEQLFLIHGPLDPLTALLNDLGFIVKK